MNITTNMLFLICLFVICTVGTLDGQNDPRHYFSGFPNGDFVRGFGFETKGGEGGRIIRVTNLNKEGEGSLGAAIREEGRRIVVFEVAGVIDLEESILTIENPNITIAGQTAPSPGITIIKGGIRVVTHEVILQHIRVRSGEAGNAKKSGWEVDGIATGKGASNVVIDHCSASWTTDENISASGPRFDGENIDQWRKNTSHKILITNCIIAEGLSNATHAKGEHSKGSLIHDNTTEIAIVGNLYASNVRRNPFFKGGAQGVVVNNLIYNPGRAAVHYNLSPREWTEHDWVSGKMAVVGNMLLRGADTNPKMAFGFYRGPCQVYWRDNIEIGILGQKAGQVMGSATLVREKPIWPDAMGVRPAQEVKRFVLDNAGARPWDRDGVDKRIIQGVVDGTGRIIDSESEVGGYPVEAPTSANFEPQAWDLRTMMPKGN